jgi:hypothetical protein
MERSNKLYKCAINPVINQKPVYKSRTPLKYVAISMKLSSVWKQIKVIK